MKGVEKFASYDHFTVTGASANYKIEVQKPTQKDGDIMTAANGHPFTAGQTPGPKGSIGCIGEFGGWWFNPENCSKALSLNGLEHVFSEMKVKRVVKQ